MPGFWQSWTHGHFIFLYVLKSLMIWKRNRNGNSSNYEEKVLLMQQQMLLPAADTSLVKTSSRWHVKEIDRKKAFPVAQLPFCFRGIARYWQLLSFFLALLFPFSEYKSVHARELSYDHLSPHHSVLQTHMTLDIFPCFSFLKKTYFLVSHLRIVCSLQKFWKLQDMYNERKSIHSPNIQYTY